MHTIFKKACFLSQLTPQKPRNTFSSLSQTKSNKKHRFHLQDKREEAQSTVSGSTTNKKT